ncbi:CDP-archaeol synthase [Luteolibacter sp. SL250]|uniref:phosphatidate cytidylyltransferase n=1 Tax=Luteolibacter sp. SL250 TaxID=2995170 RepID=UPI0022718657|nr:CDP-archaeol synthase [Luteolibacter sp. SL250]WAC21553.1 CDP-archaeol synthase [Luteolibacter sp. SL250]
MADSSTPAPSPSKGTVFIRRTASTLLLWAIVAGTCYSMNAAAYLGLLAGLTLLAAMEYYRMVQEDGVHCYPRLGMLTTAAYCGLVFHTFHSGAKVLPPEFDLFAIAFITMASFALQLRYPVHGNDVLLSVASTVLGFIYIPFLFNFATRIVFIVPGPSEVPGAFLLLWLLAVTKFTDMGAYIVGSMIGKKKMIPHISPGKTWEGFAGAVFFSQLAACGLYALMPVKLAVLSGWPHVIALGFLLCLLAVIGDLAESVVKRALGAKDSGKILPGIGGSLDLIDSICFTAPALYFYLKWVLKVA